MSAPSAEAIELVAAVTEPIRRQLLDLLLESGESTPTALAGGVPVTRQAVSKHLAVLERAGLVEGERSGRAMIYRINAPRLDDATRSLSELALTWDRRLLRIKQLAEAAATERRRARAR